ncbi:MAG: hypothetical protein IPL40_04580 [Proteobacteria bacterium]|nr:hypothetical protein [Pseudomonadota bacterium]
MLLALGLGGCGELRYEGFLGEPIPATLEQGVLVARVRVDDGPPLRAVVDNAASLTLLRQSEGFRSRRRRVALRLLDALRPTVTRFVFHDLELLEASAGPIGLDAPLAVDLLLGVDVLAHFAVTLNYLGVADGGSATAAPRALTLRSELAGSNDQLAADCDVTRLVTADGLRSERCAAVFAGGLRGGGRASIAGESTVLPGRRVIAPLCLLPDDYDPTGDAAPPTAASGLDAVAIVASGVGTPLIARSAFEQLQARHPELQEAPGHTLYLPTGSEIVSLVSIPRAALVADMTRTLDDPRRNFGPCGELARRWRLLRLDRFALDAAQDRDERGAAVAWVGAPIAFAIVDDRSPLLQGLRQELRPRVPDLDIVLGGEWLSFFETDLDYPASRMMLRCTAAAASSAVCRTLPFCRQDQRPPCGPSVAMP